MPQFKVHSEYEPAGDQPQAIAALSQGVENGLREQVLKGVTGSGKTYTMAKVIEQVQRPTLVLAHNHPSGVALPSENDRAVTLWVRDALNTMDIRLLDHIIVADGDFVSMNQSGYLL